MNRVLFLLGANDDSYSLLPFFLKYKINDREIDIVEPYQSGNINESAVTGKFYFKFQNTFIDLIYEKHLPHSYDSILEYLNNLDVSIYDKIYIFREWSSYDSNLKNFGNVEIVYFKADENFHKTDDDVKDFLENHKMISSASVSFNHRNFYFEPTINLFVFYYLFGFDYLSYESLNVNKSNLMGLYYLPGYNIIPLNLIYLHLKIHMINNQIQIDNKIQINL